jgi:hypothetical protein
MGADLYIKDISMREAKKALKRTLKVRKADRKSKRIISAMFECLAKDGFYFRDSYDDSNLASKLGFSWSRDVAALLDQDSCLTGQNIVTIQMKLLADIDMNAPPNADQQLVLCVISLLGGTFRSAVNTGLDIDYFSNRRSLLLLFFEIARRSGKSIECAL